MGGFQNDEALIRALKGSRIEMNKAVNWILNESNWRDAVGILIRKFQMNLEIKNEVFYEGLTALTINVRKQEFKGDSQLKTYFEGICKNILKTRLTKKSRDAERFVLMDTTQMAQKEKVDQRDIEEVERQTEIQSTLRSLISKLGENCKKVLGYIALGFSMREIAEKVSMERQSVKNKAFKCRSQLRELASTNPALMSQIKNLI